MNQKGKEPDSQQQQQHQEGNDSSNLQGQSADERFKSLDSRMDRVTTTLETLIGIIKATEPQQPQQPALIFDPVTTGTAARQPDASHFAFYQGNPSSHPSATQVQGSAVSMAGAPQPPPPGPQQAPLPFPTHEQLSDNQGVNPVYLEPPKIAELWFSGETKQLATFLRAIRDFLYPRQAFFASQSRMIVWISRHFGHRPSEKSDSPSAAENWYNALVLSNARAQGEYNPYADLDRMPFVHPMLTSVTTFEQGLIDSFGDKFQLDSAKRALAACKQGKRSIEEYNAEYSTLCYQVVNSEDARIDKYVEGLNYDIINKAMSKEWLEEPTLAGKMRRALDASRQLAALSRIPNRHTSNHSSSPSTTHHSNPSNSGRQPSFAPPATYQHPNSTNRSPDAMDIDAVSSRGAQTPEQRFERLFRTVCLAQRVCFRCLQKTVPPDHTNSLNCPNGRVTPEARKKFVEQYRFAVPVQVSEVSFGPRPPGESITKRRSMFSVPSPYQARPIDQHHQHQQVSNQQTDLPGPFVAEPDVSELDRSAFAFQELLEEVEEAGVSTIQVQLDCSKAGRMLIPVSFKTSSAQSTIASVLIDTGSMANFISDRFVAKHGLPTHNRQKPIKCVGFDGSSGVGGIVTKDWSVLVGIRKRSTRSSTHARRQSGVCGGFFGPWGGV
ncbi:hypothetical protein PGT21_022218 [Puccinia graminis f. sp. tritici]|uniref:Retrotransposon gag domain-containing protein n=1 Tax=Puccinia graminis f. sp. tritici TaxID=56615 RepID=A0A5B0PLF9_PUCGR|nr:hypothetical protein PGT21_022218 [Puccinia graminis f. sp. tritici]